jgi:hypothetical protein
MFRLPEGSVGQCQVLLFPLEVLVNILRPSFMTPVNPTCLAFELVKASHMSSFNVYFLNFFSGAEAARIFHSCEQGYISCQASNNHGSRSGNTTQLWMSRALFRIPVAFQLVQTWFN